MEKLDNVPNIATAMIKGMSCNAGVTHFQNAITPSIVVLNVLEKNMICSDEKLADSFFEIIFPMPAKTLDEMAIIIAIIDLGDSGRIMISTPMYPRNTARNLCRLILSRRINIASNMVIIGEVNPIDVATPSCNFSYA